MLKEIIKRTLRVPIIYDWYGDGEKATRQLDVALMTVGFKLSRGLFDHLSRLRPAIVMELAGTILAAVKELVGDNVEHNVYFIDFPERVPATEEFWLQEVLRLFFTGDTEYGRYQHSYREVLARRDEFVPSDKTKVTLLHLGKALPEETLALYHLLATSNIPLNDTDRELLAILAESCLRDPQPETIPVRESKAIINQVRIVNQQPILVDTVTDILRLASAISGGDVTLQEKTKFRNFRRPVRKALLAALNDVISNAPAQIADILQYRERWKRLGEKLHPHEYAAFTGVQEIFAVARGKKFYSLEARVEMALRDHQMTTAITLLSRKPGLFVRTIDRLLRTATESERALLLTFAYHSVEKVSGRVLLSLREHLINRVTIRTSRIFTNRRGRAWVTQDVLKPLEETIIQPYLEMLDETLLKRIPCIPHLVAETDITRVAIPLSGKNTSNGFAIMPRGSTMAIEEGILRFFVYWKQASRRTDYDLSAILLDEDFTYVDHLSYTRLRMCGGVHSGDLIEAPYGASEFIDIDLENISAKYLIPSINIYAGEGFDEAESCYFGIMSRTPEQKGKPFEPATVRMKSDLRGAGKVALPLVFIRRPTGWTAKWMHLYLKGAPNFNRVETNQLSTGLLARSIVDRQYTSVAYLVDLMRTNAGKFSWASEKTAIESTPTTFIGLQAPDEIPEETKVITLSNLHELIPG